jgi:hypothetical protein
MMLQSHAEDQAITLEEFLWMRAESYDEEIADQHANQQQPRVSNLRVTFHPIPKSILTSSRLARCSNSFAVFFDTLFIHRRTFHEGCALRSFLSCVKTGRLSLAA